MATTRRGPKVNKQKNPAAREAFLLYRKERNAKKRNPQSEKKLALE